MQLLLGPPGEKLMRPLCPRYSRKETRSSGMLRQGSRAVECRIAEGKKIAPRIARITADCVAQKTKSHHG